MDERSPVQRPGRYERREARQAAVRRQRVFAGVVAVVTVFLALAVLTVPRFVGAPRPSEVVAPAPAASSSGTAATTTPAGRVAASSGTTRAAEPTASADATLLVAAVGDMIFGRKVGDLIDREGGAAPLARVASLLSSADVAIGNLENAMSARGTADADKDVVLIGDPRGIKGLSRAGFDFVTLANNHMLDYGPVALQDTIDALDRAGIRHSGAGMDRSAAWEAASMETKAGSVAHLAFSNILPEGFVATDSRAGVASAREIAPIQEAIRDARRRHDKVIVSFHFGVEYAEEPNGRQVELARAAVDAGADLVLAHHPHVIQGVEMYRGRLIAYSLGDFVFDHFSRKTGEAFILNVTLGEDGVRRANVVPVYLDRWGRPKVVHGEEARVILQRLKDLSAKRGTTVQLDGDVAEVVVGERR